MCVFLCVFLHVFMCVCVCVCVDLPGLVTGLDQETSVFWKLTVGRERVNLIQRLIPFVASALAQKVLLHIHVLLIHLHCTFTHFSPLVLQCVPSIQMHAHTHMHKHMHTLTCTHIHTHIHTHSHTHTLTHICTHVYLIRSCLLLEQFGRVPRAVQSRWPSAFLSLLCREAAAGRNHHRYESDSVCVKYGWATFPDIKGQLGEHVIYFAT